MKQLALYFALIAVLTAATYSLNNVYAWQQTYRVELLRANTQRDLIVLQLIGITPSQYQGTDIPLEEKKNL
jgi:hypothetical protein